MPKSRRNIKKRYLIGLLILVFLSAVLAYQIPFSQLGGRRLVVSQATTYLTKPLREHGMVNYRNAANEMMSEGVTADNNAFIPLSRYIDFGIDSEHPTYAEFLNLLGVESLEMDQWIEGLDNFYRSEMSHEEHRRIDSQIEEALHRPWTAEEFPQIGKWFEIFNSSLDAIVEATDRPNFFSPIVNDNNSCTHSVQAMHPPTELLRVAVHLRIRVMNSIARQNNARVTADIRALRALAGYASHNTNWFLPNAKSLNTHARYCEQVFLTHASVTGQDLEALNAALMRAEYRFDLADQVNTTDYRYYLLDFIQELCVGGGILYHFEMGGKDKAPWFDVFAKMNRLTDWNVTLSRHNQKATRLVEILRTPNARVRLDALDDFILQTKLEYEKLFGSRASLLALLGGPKAKGRWMAGYLGHHYTDLDTLRYFAEWEIEDQFGRDLSTVAFALERYKLASDEYPLSLKSLVPEFIETLPMDPFTNEPVIYRLTPTGYIVYGLGKDQIDNGGRQEFEFNATDKTDLAFRVGESEFERFRRHR